MRERIREIPWLKKLTENQWLLVLAFFTGLGSGAAAVLLKTLIHWLSVGFTGWFSKETDYLMLLVYPGLGMLVSMLLVRYVFKDDISHGVTKVLRAVSRDESRIRPHNTFSSIITSSITIGSGGSVGAEAPIVYTGAAIGSNLGRKFGLSYKSITILLGCGAAGAVSGIFKAPMAGILFTLEILLFNISMNSILPLLTSSVTAAAVSYLLLGDDVSFSSTIDRFVMGNIPYYMFLGLFCGLMSLYFIRMTMMMEDKIHSVKNMYFRWLISSAGLGVLIYFFPPLYGEGYAGLEYMLNGAPLKAAGDSMFMILFENEWLFLLFFFVIMLVKVVAMSFTNAGGGIGGTFGPTLIVGGIAGFVVARFINITGVHTLPEANFALVGMAGLMAGVMQAPMTAIFLIAEITGGYDLLMPLIITSLVSFGVIRIFEPYSIYSKRLAKSGELLTHDSDSAVLTLLRTSSLVETDFLPVRMEQNLGDVVKAVSASRRNLFPVLDDDGIFQGFISLDDIRSMMFDKDKYESVHVYDIMSMAPDFIIVDEKMDTVMKKFETTGAWNLPVLDAENHYIGFISKSKIFTSYRDRLRDVSQE